MEWLVFRRVWIIFSNLCVVGLLSFSLREAYLNEGDPSGGLVAWVGISILIAGIALDWLRPRLAAAVNGGFFGLIGVGILVNVLFFNSGSHREPEVGIAIGLGCVPFTFVAVFDLFLYRITRFSR